MIVAVLSRRQNSFKSLASPIPGTLRTLYTFHFSENPKNRQNQNTHKNSLTPTTLYNPVFSLDNPRHNAIRTLILSVPKTSFPKPTNPQIIAHELEDSIRRNKLEDALDAYQRYINEVGIPDKYVMTKYLNFLSQLNELEKASQVVDYVAHVASNPMAHLERETSESLCLKFAIADMPVPASALLRTMVAMKEYPPLSFWSRVIPHMGRTPAGAWLVYELMKVFAGPFKRNKVDVNKRKNKVILEMKPHVTVFNMAIRTCLHHGLNNNAEFIYGLMDSINVRRDSVTYGLLLQIYERNGRRNELRKLKVSMDRDFVVKGKVYSQYYHSMLICHFNFGDLDSAAEVILEMIHRAKATQSSFEEATSVNDAIDTSIISSSLNTKRGECGIWPDVDNVQSKRRECGFQPNVDNAQSEKGESGFRPNDGNDNPPFDVSKMLMGELDDSGNGHFLVNCMNGVAMPNLNAFVKLIKGFLEAKKIWDLADFLVKVHRLQGPAAIEFSVGIQVIKACIESGRLNEAHDLIYEMKVSEIPVGPEVYNSLLKAYSKARRTRDATSLLKQVRDEGILLDVSCYDALHELYTTQKPLENVLDLFTEMRKVKVDTCDMGPGELMDSFVKENGPKLMVRLLEELKDDQKPSVGVYEWNSTIHFFCKTGLFGDANRSLRKMILLGHQPNAQTYYTLVHTYNLAGKRSTKIEKIWNDIENIRACNEESPLKLDIELLDSFLYCFIRASNFGKALEVVKIMEDSGMFIDKYKCRRITLKYHSKLFGIQMERDILSAEKKYKKKEIPSNRRERKESDVLSDGDFERRREIAAFKKWVQLML